METPNKCSAITARKTPCKRNALPDAMFCKLHDRVNKMNKTAKTTASMYTTKQVAQTTTTTTVDDKNQVDVDDDPFDECVTESTPICRLANGLTVNARKYVVFE